MVHRPNRLVDIFDTMRKYHLEPKRMRLVYPYANKAANMVLIEAVREVIPSLLLKNRLLYTRRTVLTLMRFLKCMNR
mgnify:CR=1 FL=1